MGMGLPVIMALPDGEATTLVKQYNCGVVIQPEDAEQLTKTIIELKENSDQLYKYKQSSLKASLEFSRDVKANEMLELLRSHTQKL
jgi:glycosyltransferase involved in cell wall biosynthesis